METEAEFEAPTWNQIYALLLSQAKKIRESGFKPNVIVGVTRGGWVPARVLADLLEITELVSLGVEFYVGVAETLSEPVLTQRVSADVQDKKALLVDDVTDTGKSLQLAKEHLRQRGVREVRIATLYRKPFSVTKPDYCEKKTRCWVVFPWDFKETIRNILRKRQDKCVINVEVEKLVTAGLPKKRIEEFLKEELEAGNC